MPEGTVPERPDMPRPTDAASRLLGRPPPENYLEAWARALTRELGEDLGEDRFSVGVFRLGEELFALPTDAVVEVHPRAPVRSLPGRTGDVFRGLVSLRGEIHLCASLAALFQLERPAGGEAAGGEANGEGRLLVVRRGGDRWALLVDAVLDFERFEAGELKPAQVTVTKSAVHFTDGVVETSSGPAARIDPERLFEGLTRSLQ